VKFFFLGGGAAFLTPYPGSVVLNGASGWYKGYNQLSHFYAFLKRLRVPPNTEKNNKDAVIHKSWKLCPYQNVDFHLLKRCETGQHKTPWIKELISQLVALFYLHLHLHLQVNFPKKKNEWKMNHSGLLHHPPSLVWTHKLTHTLKGF